MPPLPADVRRSIVTAMGAYMRQASPAELPRSLRAFKNFRSKALFEKEKQLMAALDDDVLRARVQKWLDDKPGISAPEAKALRIAADREAGWEDELAGMSRPRSRARRSTSDGNLTRKLSVAKERAEAARAELREARRALRDRESEWRRERSSLEAELAAARAELKQARAEADRADRDAGAAHSRLERTERKARKDVEKARSEQEDLKGRLRSVRAESAQLKRELDRLKPKPRKRQPRAQRASRRPRHREPLPAPKGLLSEARETLQHWLSVGGVTLLVDGYNVTKQERGFGELELEVQRDRLVSELQRLATRHPNASIVIVFDGSEVGPGTARRKRGGVRIEYSRPGESADDHIVAALEQLPPDPVVLVTSDKELQGRARARGATIAASPQLLQVLNKG